jgi:hypothetical protein
VFFIDDGSANMVAAEQAAGGDAASNPFAPGFAALTGESSIEAQELTAALASWTPPASADLTGDGVIDAEDLVIVLASWGPCPDKACPADLDSNGDVDQRDVLTVLATWE